jgi:lipopolysaccharide/colanic/teichoic acid biosynthesis glycosyltransferase
MIMQPTAARHVVEAPLGPVTDANSRMSAAAPIPPLKTKPHSIHNLKNLHSRSDIDAILQRECARCERNGQEFSLVIVAAADTGARRHLHRLGRLLCKRVRATDEIGWFDPTRLCAVLPDTTAAGARLFVRQFTLVSNHRALSPICQVFSYPQHKGTNGQPLNIERILEGMNATSRHEAPVPSEDHAANNGAGDLSPLLIRPMPMWKRGIDMLMGTFMVMAFSPVFIVVGMAIRISDGGPILFRQRRAGLGGRPFTMLKFRTMVVDAEKKKALLRAVSEQDGPAFKIKHDPRITRLGRWLRETSLDELPQLINVIKGDMSLVGPRPLPVEESDQCDAWHRRRLDVTPGLTCIWQVKGRCKVTFANWCRMDRAYIGRRSLWQDIKLIVLTVPSVLRRRGAQ